MPLMPKTKAPELAVETVDGDRWHLSEQTPRNITLIVFYRGLHCPVCTNYLRDLDRKVADFAERGVDVITASGDDGASAAATKAEWGLKQLAIGYGQSIASMRKWGLYISTATKESEPAEFGEPGMFLIRPDGEVFYVAVNNAPWGRPSFCHLLGGIDYVLAHNSPPRGVA